MEKYFHACALVYNSSSSITLLLGVEEMVHTKLSKEHTWRVRELDLKVHGLASAYSDPLTTAHSFLKNQLDISDLTIDRAWLGFDGHPFPLFPMFN